MLVNEFNLNLGYLHKGSKNNFLKLLGLTLLNFDCISLSISAVVPRKIPLALVGFI